jgi:outer membrane protein
MKKIISAVVAVVAVGLSQLASAQVPSSSIVTVDMNKIFNDYWKTPIASAKLKETAEGFNKENEELVNNYRKLIDDLNKLREEADKPEYTTEVKAQKKKAIQDKLTETQKAQRDIEEYRRTHQQELERQTQRMRQSILKEITEIIVKEAKDAGYTLVLDKSGNTLNGVPGVVFAQDSLEITDRIVKILNRNAPKITETPKADEPKPDKK